MKESGLAMWKISNGSTSILIKEMNGKKLSHFFQGRKGSKVDESWQWVNQHHLP